MKQILLRPKAAMPPPPVNKGSGENTIENGTFSVLSPVIFWVLFNHLKRTSPTGETYFPHSPLKMWTKKGAHLHALLFL